MTTDQIERIEDGEPARGTFPDLSDQRYGWEPPSRLVGLCAQVVVTLRMGAAVHYFAQTDEGCVLATDAGKLTLPAAVAAVMAPVHAERDILGLSESIVRERYRAHGIGLALAIRAMEPRAAIYGDLASVWAVGTYRAAIIELAALVEEREELDAPALSVFAVTHALTNQPEAPDLATYRAFSIREKQQ